MNTATGFWSRHERGPLCSGTVAHNIPEDTFSKQGFQQDKQKQNPGEAPSETTVGGVRLQVNKKYWKRLWERQFEPFGGIFGILWLGLR